MNEERRNARIQQAGLANPEERREARRRLREALALQGDDPMADANLSGTIAGLLAYRPGVGTWPHELPAVKAALDGLPIEVRRYLALGARNLHDLITAERRAQ